MKYFEITLIIWNIITFSMMGIDKYKAEHNLWRIRESTLLLAAFAMGGLGALIGSRAFRHKTQKTIFKIFLPLSIFFNMIVAYFIIFRIVWIE